MKTLEVSGYSDDIVCLDGSLLGYEEYDTYGAGVNRGVLMVRCPPNENTETAQKIQGFFENR